MSPADATGIIWRQNIAMTTAARNGGSDGFLVDRDGDPVEEQDDGGGGGASTATISFLACAVLVVVSSG